MPERSSATIVLMRCALAVCLTITLCACHFFFFGSKSTASAHLEKAEELSRQGKYDEAIEEYREHIDYRLHLKKRPEWENPYFYLLLIGDIQLGQGQVEKALATYEEAEHAEVDKYLVSDRYRYVASYYEKQDRLDEALKIISKYRGRDPLLFEAMGDRISKEMLRREEEKTAPSPLPSAFSTQ